MVEGDSIKNKSDCKYAKCAFEIINYDNLVQTPFNTIANAVQQAYYENVQLYYKRE